MRIGATGIVTRKCNPQVGRCEVNCAPHSFTRNMLPASAALFARGPCLRIRRSVVGILRGVEELRVRESLLALQACFALLLTPHTLQIDAAVYERLKPGNWPPAS